MKKRAKIEILAYLMLFVLLLLLVFIAHDYTVARYSDGAQASYTVELKDFDMDFNLTYTSDTTHQLVAVKSAELRASKGVVKLSPTEYATMKFDTIYKGEGKCYYRFKITESWQHETEDNTRTITPRSLSEYTFGADFYDNRSYDGYIYCITPMAGASATDELTTQAVTRCVAGIDAPDLLAASDAANAVEISVELDAVQWNRVKEKWGLTKLPWE